MKTFNNGYTIEKIPILETQNFAEDLDVLLVLEPQSALGMQVEQLLAEYFQGGGQLWFVSDLAPIVCHQSFRYNGLGSCCRAVGIISILGLSNHTFN